jgi:hypothetical protein
MISKLVGSARMEYACGYRRLTHALYKYVSLSAMRMNSLRQMPYVKLRLREIGPWCRSSPLAVAPTSEKYPSAFELLNFLGQRKLAGCDLTKSSKDQTSQLRFSLMSGAFNEEETRSQKPKKESLVVQIVRPVLDKEKSITDMTRDIPSGLQAN